MLNELRIQYKSKLLHVWVLMFKTAKYIYTHSTNYQKYIMNNVQISANDLERVGMSPHMNKNEHKCQNGSVHTAFALHIRDSVKGA